MVPLNKIKPAGACLDSNAIKSDAGTDRRFGGKVANEEDGFGRGCLIFITQKGARTLVSLIREGVTSVGCVSPVDFAVDTGNCDDNDKWVMSRGFSRDGENKWQLG